MKDEDGTVHPCWCTTMAADTPQHQYRANAGQARAVWYGENCDACAVAQQLAKTYHRRNGEENYLDSDGNSRKWLETPRSSNVPCESSIAYGTSTCADLAAAGYPGVAGVDYECDATAAPGASTTAAPGASTAASGDFQTKTGMMLRGAGLNVYGGKKGNQLTAKKAKPTPLIQACEAKCSEVADCKGFTVKYRRNEKAVKCIFQGDKATEKRLKQAKVWKYTVYLKQ